MGQYFIAPEFIMVYSSAEIPALGKILISTLKITTKLTEFLFRADGLLA